MDIERSCTLALIFRIKQKINLVMVPPNINIPGNCRKDLIIKSFADSKLRFCVVYINHSQI